MSSPAEGLNKRKRLISPQCIRPYCIDTFWHENTTNILSGENNLILCLNSVHAQGSRLKTAILSKREEKKKHTMTHPVKSSDTKMIIKKRVT